jgi:hypothetical protein
MSGVGGVSVCETVKDGITRGVWVYIALRNGSRASIHEDKQRAQLKINIVISNHQKLQRDARQLEMVLRLTLRCLVPIPRWVIIGRR